MKKIRTATALLLCLCVLLAGACCGAETYIELNGFRPDQTVYQGYWQNLYLQILDEHSYKIHSYQSKPIEWDGEYGRSLSCFPVGLRDLNDDGAPELYFLEANGDRGSTAATRTPASAYCMYRGLPDWTMTKCWASRFT